MLFHDPFVDERTTEMPCRVIAWILLNATHRELQPLLCWNAHHVANHHPMIPAVEVALIEFEECFTERDFAFLQQRRTPSTLQERMNGVLLKEPPSMMPHGVAFRVLVANNVFCQFQLLLQYSLLLVFGTSREAARIGSNPSSLLI